MNIDGILSTLNHHQVRYILIGGGDSGYKDKSRNSLCKSFRFLHDSMSIGTSFGGTKKRPHLRFAKCNSNQGTEDTRVQNKK